MGNYNLKSGIFRCENCFSIYRMTIEPGLPESYINLECKCSTSRISIKNFLIELTKGTKCKPKCYECQKNDEKNTSYCEDCNHLYCGKCINKDHQKHNNISLTKLDFNCVFHQKENFCAFCKDCVINICPKCIEIKKHMNHDVIEFDKILMKKTERDFLKDKFNLVQEKLLFNNNLVNNYAKNLKNKDIEKIINLGKDNSEQNKIILETVNFFMYLYDNSKFKNYNIIINFIEHVNNLNVNKFKLSDKNKIEDNLEKLQKYLSKDFIVINGEEQEEMNDTNDNNSNNDSLNKQEQITNSKTEKEKEKEKEQSTSITNNKTKKDKNNNKTGNKNNKKKNDQNKNKENKEANNKKEKENDFKKTNIINNKKEQNNDSNNINNNLKKTEKIKKNENNEKKEKREKINNIKLKETKNIKEEKIENEIKEEKNEIKEEMEENEIKEENNNEDNKEKNENKVENNYEINFNEQNEFANLFSINRFRNKYNSNINLMMVNGLHNKKIYDINLC